MINQREEIVAVMSQQLRMSRTSMFTKLIFGAKIDMILGG